jgi:transcriptional regulator with PAS, ATPase and Fis domain
MENIIGESDVMKEIKNTIAKVAKTGSTVLIRGESGTGKELIARAIHAESDRRDQPFVGINCSAIPETLIESEFFGYAKGAFSGASPGGRIGKFELANKGVLFLDEIGDMPLYLQTKVLRVLQERSFSRVGSNETIDLDIRVVAATNRNLEEMIRQSQFRRDLFYRLNVIPIEVPPLIQRGDDLELLVEAFLTKYNALFGKDITGIDREAMKLLKKYKWPGNVRELENIIQYMVTMAGSSGMIMKDTLPEGIILGSKTRESKGQGSDSRTLKELEEEHIRNVLEKYGMTTEGKKKAAKALGIGIATLYRKLGEIYQNDKNL